MNDLDFRWDITSEEVYAPDAQIDETDEERRERRLAEMDAWGEAYGCLDDDQDDEEDAGE